MSPATSRGRARANAVIATMMAGSTGPTVRREATTSRVKAINPPKLQLPTSNNQGVILSTNFPKALMFCLFCSCGAAREVSWWGSAGAGSVCDIFQLLSLLPLYSMIFFASPVCRHLWPRAIEKAHGATGWYFARRLSVFLHEGGLVCSKVEPKIGILKHRG